MSDLGRRAFFHTSVLAGLGTLALGAASREPLALERSFPAFASLPRAGLWGDSAPLADEGDLAQSLALGSLCIVRDDLAGTVFAGGKARKLDLLVGDALQRGVTTLVTTGGTGSNHARSTALAAQAASLQCRLVLLPQPETPEVTRNLAAMRAAGAHVTTGAREAVARAQRAADAAGSRETWIPMGGTSPLGNVAFVDAAVDLLRRVSPVPDVIVTALGSTGSAVGLAIGCALSNATTRVHAVRCSSPATSSRAVLDDGITATVDFLRTIEPRIPAALALEARARIGIDGSELGGGYAVPTAHGGKAAERFREAGIVVESTYGAKAAAALFTGAHRWRGRHIALWMGSDAKWLALAK